MQIINRSGNTGNCIIFIFTSILFFYACKPAGTKGEPHQQNFFIKGSSGNRLEVLDWGGEGEPIIFLAGLGNTAHVFANFAPAFCDRFHVYGLTRRGFGKSEQSDDYSEKALIADIHAVIDSLHLKKVILVGHSIAGEEISKFASLYPEKINKVIYLDAAYDRTTPEFKNIVGIITQTPAATSKDSLSFSTWKDFNKTNYGIEYPDEELRQISVFTTQGKYLRDVTPESVIGALVGSLESPDYKHLICPALAIYADYSSVEGAIPFYSKMDYGNQQRADSFFKLIRQYGEREKNRFKSQVRNGTVKTISAHPNHYIFISNAVETENMIRSFLQ